MVLACELRGQNPSWWLECLYAQPQEFAKRFVTWQQPESRESGPEAMILLHQHRLLPSFHNLPKRFHWLEVFKPTCERRGDSPHSNYYWVMFPKYSCVEALTHSVTPWTFKKVIKIDNNSKTIIQRDWHRFKKREICRGYTSTERRPTEGSVGR